MEYLGHVDVAQADDSILTQQPGLDVLTGPVSQLGKKLGRERIGQGIDARGRSFLA
jgi:hypothetical protein